MSLVNQYMDSLVLVYIICSFNTNQQFISNLEDLWSDSVGSPGGESSHDWSRFCVDFSLRGCDKTLWIPVKKCN